MHEEAPALFSHESINMSVLKAKAFDLSWTEVDERVMPNPMSTPKGCPFSTRCPVVMESYRTEKPKLRTVGKDPVSACLRLSAITVSHTHTPGEHE